jgi:hypothetical protein
VRRLSGLGAPFLSQCLTVTPRPQHCRLRRLTSLVKACSGVGTLTLPSERKNLNLLNNKTLRVRRIFHPEVNSLVGPGGCVQVEFD